MKRIRYNPTWILRIDPTREFAVSESTLTLKTRGITLADALAMNVGEAVNVRISAPNYGVQVPTSNSAVTLTRVS